MQINQDVSSEMFCSLMRVLHDHLPCTKNFFIQKHRYRNLLNTANPDRNRSTSPSVKEIASPKILKGLQFKRQMTSSSQEEAKILSEASSPSRSQNRNDDFRIKQNFNP